MYTEGYPIMKSKQKNHFTWRQGLLVAVLVIAVYVLVPQLDQFRASFSAIQDANIALLGLAFCSILVAALAAALSYEGLVFKRVSFYRIALIQYAGMFINRLFPAGFGRLSLFVDFLYRQGHTFAQASTIAAVNNGLGFLGHITLLAVAGIVTGFGFMPHVTFNEPILYGIGAIIVGAAAWFVLRYVKQAQNITKFLYNVLHTLTQFRTREAALLRAYICCIVNTCLHVLALALVIKAFNVDLPVAAVLVVLTGGLAAATVTPTPGGLVGVEAALTAVLISYGINDGTALAIALSYRLVSYWLPIFPGIAAFWFVQKRNYI